MSLELDSRKTRQQTDERVIVLLDDSPESMQSLEMAAGLARRCRGTLLGVFVEELDLVRSAGFAFAGEIGALSGSFRPRSIDRIATELGRRVRQVRLALERTAAASGVKHELIVRRGKVVQEILTLAGVGDTLIVGRVGWSSRLGRAIGSVPLALARDAPGAVLIWTEKPRISVGRVAVLAEQGSTLESALAIAIERAQLHGGAVCVLLPPTLDESEIELIKHQAAALFTDAGPPIEIRSLAASNAASLLHALGQVRAVELVLSRRGGLLATQAGAQLLERIRLPVYIAP